MRSRTVLAFVATLFLVAVPAAFATTGLVGPASPGQAVIQPIAAETPQLHAEARRKTRAAVRQLAAKRRAALPKVSVPPQMASIALDARALLFAAVVATLTALACGVAPAILASRAAAPMAGDLPLRAQIAENPSRRGLAEGLPRSPCPTLLTRKLQAP